MATSMRTHWFSLSAAFHRDTPERRFGTGDALFCRYGASPMLADFGTIEPKPGLSLRRMTPVVSAGRMAEAAPAHNTTALPFAVCRAYEVQMKSSARKFTGWRRNSVLFGGVLGARPREHLLSIESPFLLLVEDNHLLALAMADLPRQAGYAVQSSETARGASTALKGEQHLRRSSLTFACPTV